jgi:hypothetical protein
MDITTFNALIAEEDHIELHKKCQENGVQPEFLAQFPIKVASQEST